MEISYKAFEQLAKSLEGLTVLTIKNKQPFSIEVAEVGQQIIFIPQSTGKPRNVRRSEIEGVLVEFFKIGSYIKKDYENISRNASYILALIYQFTDRRSSQIALSLESVNDKHEEAVKNLRANIANCSAKNMVVGNAYPEKIVVITETYVRDPRVAAFTLDRANGVCEACGKPAPFIRQSTGLPYLEVHHKKRLADGGADEIENTIAVCPNCHREAHYGKEC